MSSFLESSDTEASAMKPSERIRAGLQSRTRQRQAEPILGARGIVKSYHKNKLEVPVLQGVDFDVAPGQFAAIVGQSGSGKSTLLHLLATLDGPDEGRIEFDGRRIDNLQPAERDWIRNQQFGMIFQFYHLLPELTAIENVLAPLMISNGIFRYWSSRRKHFARAQQLMEQVGLGHRLKHKPREMSGGEMQRAAIARALITQPRVLLADEPTGNLDAQTGGEIMSILRSLNQEDRLTIVMVTHDHAIAQQADAIVRLKEGRVEEESLDAA